MTYYKKILSTGTLAITLLLCNLTPFAAAAPTDTIETDPYENSGGGLFDGIKAPNGAILPQAVYPYLPSDSTFWMSGDMKNAPDIGAIESAIIFLAKVFVGEDQGGADGKILWTIARAVVVFGIMLSGYLTFKAVAQGKKGPGEAGLAFVIKCILCIIMLTYVCANIPPVLIGLSNAVTKSVSSWFGGGQADALKTVFDTKMNAAHAASLAMHSKLLESLQVQPDQYKTSVARNIVGVFQPEADRLFITQRAADWNTIKQKHAKGATNMDINAEISSMARQKVSQLTQLTMNTAAKTLKTMTDDEQVEQYMTQEVFRAAQGVDVTGLSYPDKAIRMYGYMAFAYIGLSIWGLGIASLIWVMLYALPEEWNMGDILFTGLKACFAVVLTVILITIYMSAATKQIEKDVDSISTLNETWTETLVNAAKGTGSAAASFASNITDPGAMWARTMGFFTGLSLQSIFIGMLILTAPAQAAAMLKGGNGIAEHAKTGMTNSGMSSSSMAGTFGVQGQSSGARVGGGFTPDSIMSSRSDAFSHLAPKKP